MSDRMPESVIASPLRHHHDNVRAQFPIYAQLAKPLEGNRILGQQIAIKICGDCHDATGSERFEVGPSFEDIANLPSTTALSLKPFLRSNHSNMPNFIISGADTDDVIAYILSLKRK
jgi:mono/diheme cytochrome c family protein